MMMAILLCCSSQVQAAQDGDYTYIIADGNTYGGTPGDAQITKYTGAGGDVTIPSTLGGVPVTSIGGNAFSYRTDITTINIPQGVTDINDAAFVKCTELTSRFGVDEDW